MTNAFVKSCLLLLAVAGAVISACGISKGWAYGSTEPTPKWGPFKPGLIVHVHLGWWNVTSIVDSKYYPGKAEAVSVMDQKFGAAAVAIICAAALYALVLTFHVVASEVSPDYRPSCLPTDTALSYSAAAAGAAVLMLSLALFAGLAIGAHNYFKEDFEAKGMNADLWPVPSWAFAGAFGSGCCMIIFAWTMQASEAAPEGYSSVAYGMNGRGR